ncbi:hypothetical protein [Streptomyces paludis]|uniref:hypothetical protein n=1 Tax=Streptomyces paludis TaxID=2282738 RepID=UPI0013B44AB0|nr:hypothetical protein [Streptomyces paludis]
MATMTAAVDEQTFWGVTALAISFTVLILGILYAANSGQDEGDRPPPPPVEPEETYSYTCYCHRDPVHITIRLHQVPRVFGRGRRLP